MDPKKYFSSEEILVVVETGLILLRIAYKTLFAI
jgi:hypothetical protein